MGYSINEVEHFELLGYLVQNSQGFPLDFAEIRSIPTQVDGMLVYLLWKSLNNGARHHLHSYITEEDRYEQKILWKL